VPALRVTVFNVLVPSRKVTDPVGVPLNCGKTVAVNVTVCPNIDGFREDVNVTVVVALFTVWISALEVLVANVALPA
jgi:hypothetical protein